MNELDARHYLRKVRLMREKVDSFTEYPFSLVAVRSLEEIDLHPKVTLLLAYPYATILSLEADGIREVRYEETDHYIVARRFLQDHRSVLRELLK